MALADYFDRSATAVAHVLGGYDSQAIADLLNRHSVSVVLGSDAGDTEGVALTDLLVRLLARLYPSLSFAGPSPSDLEHWQQLALAINPRIEFSDAAGGVAVAVGDARSDAQTVIYAGSSAWDAYVSTEGPRPIGTTSNPMGAGAAACLAAANVFRTTFDTGALLDRDLTFSALEMSSSASSSIPSLDSLDLGEGNVIAGLGAIGNGVAWVLGRLSVDGVVHLVDPESLELDNLQRYVMAERHDVNAPKVDIIARRFDTIKTVVHHEDWANFVATNGNRWTRVLVALDSARDRRSVQATLPQWVANAWTQHGDLGVSVHPWTEEGACLRCLYLPTETLPSEDKLIARALQVERPERELQIRNLLHSNDPPPADFLDEVAQALAIERQQLEPFATRPLRDLYVQGICGGAVLPLSRIGDVDREMHVPLAHQSALAGVLLAGRLLTHALAQDPPTTMISRLDLSRPIPSVVTQPAQKDPRGICICQDDIYRDAHRLKYTADRHKTRRARKPASA